MNLQHDPHVLALYRMLLPEAQIGYRASWLPEAESGHTRAYAPMTSCGRVDRNRAVGGDPLSGRTPWWSGHPISVLTWGAQSANRLGLAASWTFGGNLLGTCWTAAPRVWRLFEGCLPGHGQASSPSEPRTVQRVQPRAGRGSSGAIRLRLGNSCGRGAGIAVHTSKSVVVRAKDARIGKLTGSLFTLE